MAAKDKVAGSLLEAYRDEYHKTCAKAQTAVDPAGAAVLLVRATDLEDCVRRLNRGKPRQEEGGI